MTVGRFEMVLPDRLVPSIDEWFGAGVVEVACGTPLREVLQMFGAPRPGRTVRAVFSGVSNAPLHGEQLDTPLAFETFATAGSGLGAAGFIVYDDTAACPSSGPAEPRGGRGTR
jgi:NADH:ubiquinone oxidoreductase subunit F (NADH-binding)